jgi:hypothetical protein
MSIIRLCDVKANTVYGNWATQRLPGTVWHMGSSLEGSPLSPIHNQVQQGVDEQTPTLPWSESEVGQGE